MYYCYEPYYIDGEGGEGGRGRIELEDEESGSEARTVESLDREQEQREQEERLTQERAEAEDKKNEQIVTDKYFNTDLRWDALSDKQRREVVKLSDAIDTSQDKWCPTCTDRLKETRKKIILKNMVAQISDGSIPDASSINIMTPISPNGEVPRGVLMISSGLRGVSAALDSKSALSKTSQYKQAIGDTMAVTVYNWLVASGDTVVKTSDEQNAIGIMKMSSIAANMLDSIRSKEGSDQDRNALSQKFVKNPFDPEILVLIGDDQKNSKIKETLRKSFPNISESDRKALLSQVAGQVLLDSVPTSDIKISPDDTKRLISTLSSGNYDGTIDKLEEMYDNLSKGQLDTLYREFDKNTSTRTRKLLGITSLLKSFVVSAPVLGISNGVLIIGSLGAFLTYYFVNKNINKDSTPAPSPDLGLASPSTPPQEPLFPPNFNASSIDDSMTPVQTPTPKWVIWASVAGGFLVLILIIVFMIIGSRINS